MLKILAKVNLSILALVFACASFSQQQILDIENSWIREMPPGAPTLAAYMTITNSAQSPVKITGISSTVSKLTELHEVKMENDLMRMQKLSELIIQPGESIELKQGSMHVMLVELTKSLQEGDEVEIKFELEDLPAVTTIVPVRKDL